MAATWRSCKLGDAITLQRGFDLPKHKRESGMVPIVSSSGITGTHNVAKVSGPGVVTGRYGTLGKSYFIKEDFWPLNTTLFVRDFKGNDQRFISYLLQTLNFENQNVAGAVPGINRNFLHLLPVKIPTLEEQIKIASILSAYDDLIENNTRRIKILEEMAQSLYREWFINFRFPGHEKVKMIDSPFGKVPKGWDAVKIGEALDFHIGGGWGKEESDENHGIKAYVIRGTDIPGAKHAQAVRIPLRYHKKSNYLARKLTAGDIVIEVSGGSKDQPLGRALLINELFLNLLRRQVLCASFCKLMRINESVVAPEIVYLHLLSIYENREITKYQTQSTGISNFKFKYFLEKELIVVPKKQEQRKFTNIVRPIFDAIQNLGIRNEKLRNTRDLLLPRLIAGEGLT